MKIYRPVKSNIISQGFGENNACAKTHIDGSPVEPFIIKTATNNFCPIGYKKFYPLIGMLGHNGIDYATTHGEPVFFNVDIPGITWLASTEVDRDGGIGVNIRSEQPISLTSLPPQARGSLNLIQRQYEKLGGKVYLKFKFWHLKKVNVHDKKPVTIGDLIGWADSTGASSGDHVHVGMKVSDEHSWFSLDGDNGYNGALDFTTYFENKFVLDVLYTPPKYFPASEHIWMFAEKKRLQGEFVTANILFALARFVKSLGY